METVDLSTGAVSEIFSGVAGLLKFGPLGLSALLLLLAIYALRRERIPPVTAQLLRQFMWVGAGLAVFFGVIAFLPSTMTPTSHMVHLRVDPLESDASDLPAPVAIVNSVKYSPPLNIIVGQEVTAIVDVTKAMNVARASVAKSNAQDAALAQISRDLANALPALQQAAIQSTDACPGGAHGVPAQSQGAVLANLSKAESAITSATTRISALN
ncbi:hypothetical protein [Devosia sp. Root105]|uniref:hypothetical protein n=1 Tax=Devosia sp. Root105 TaxID=1736423 RepID=UPI0006FF7C16|nr:hypothetical protein [Devosia sp. Root105]KQU98923.1 hypothetical protein ASC68_05905 [Devosia sp. Root105]